MKQCEGGEARETGVTVDFSQADPGNVLYDPVVPARRFQLRACCQLGRLRPHSMFGGERRAWPDRAWHKNAN
jgi:hypothetical protein